MAQYPNAIDTFTLVAGTTLFTIDDHANRINRLGSAVVAIESALGTTAAASAFTSFGASDKAQRTQGGTLQGTVIISAGTINNSTIGTSLHIGGTIGTALIAGGTAGTVNHIGGTIATSVAIKTPYARVYSGSAIPCGTVATTLSFDTELYDTDNIHAAGTPSRLTCNTAGLYHIQFNGGFVSNSTGFRTAYLQLNGGTYIAIQTFPAVNGDATLFSLCTDYVLSATDYVEVQVLQNSGGSLNIAQATHYSPEFMMNRIGPGTATA